MVYCGRPSTGCGNCKSRRIKCDETRPHCRHCTKTNRDCPGYLDQVDLIFRNEEPGRRKRARKSPSNPRAANASASKRRHDEDEDDVEGDNQATPKRQRRGSDAEVEGYKSLQWVYIDARRANSVPDLAQEKELSPSFTKRAASFSIDNTVLPHQTRNTTSGLSNAAELLYKPAKDSSALSLATQAVTIAMANLPGHDHLNQHAAHLYGRALSTTKQVMQDPAYATSDETLLTILLFALYESIVSSEHSTAAWTKHIEGAVAIVTARGMGQFESPGYIDLFGSFQSQMSTSSLHQQKHLQELPVSLGWLGYVNDNKSVELSILRTFAAMPDLLNSAYSVLSQSDSPQLQANVEALLRDAVDAQNALSAFENHLPSKSSQVLFEASASASETHDVEGAGMWLEYTHMHKNPNVTSIRNNVLVNQMLCSSVIIETLKRLDPKTYIKDERYQSAKKEIQNLVDDVCGSDPIHRANVNSGNDLERAIAEENDYMQGQLLVSPQYSAMNVRPYEQVSLRHMNKEYSEHDQGKLPQTPPDQSRDGVRHSSHHNSSPDHQLSRWWKEQMHQFDDIKIDPDLLMHDFEGHQKLVSGGFEVEIAEPALSSSSLHSEPILVV